MQNAKNRPILGNNSFKYNQLIKYNLLAQSLLRIIPNNYKLLSKLPNFRYLFSYYYQYSLPETLITLYFVNDRSGRIQFCFIDESGKVSTVKNCCNNTS